MGDRGKLLMHTKFQQTPYGLAGAKKTGLQMLFNLINRTIKIHNGAIRPLIHVFMDIFDGADDAIDLNVNIGVIPLRKIGVIGNDLAIVN